jgi:hypothetical protein
MRVREIGHFKTIALLVAALLFLSACSENMSDHGQGPDPEPAYSDIPLKSAVGHVQPMTGIVFWSDNRLCSSDLIQLEFTYVGYDEVVTQSAPESWNWSRVEYLLNSAAVHGHQAILRFYDTYPGKATTVPAYIKSMPDYKETKALSEGKKTHFPDWSHPALQSFMLEFFQRFALRYDNDPRLGFLQVGFGLWAEYHIYDPGEKPGINFPSKAFQAEFIRKLDFWFRALCWNISIDAADSSNTPFAAIPELKQAGFGLFDDSFLCRDHEGYNHRCFVFFGDEKRLKSPVGGEFSYYSDYDQKHALDPEGPYGISFEKMAAQYQVSYMIGDDQPAYQPQERIRQAGMAVGYRFRVTAFQSSEKDSRVTVENTGSAPIYYDARIVVNGTPSAESLKVLRPGQQKTFSVNSGGDSPLLTIECDRLVKGQRIEFDADLD